MTRDTVRLKQILSVLPITSLQHGGLINDSPSSSLAITNLTFNVFLIFVLSLKSRLEFRATERVSFNIRLNIRYDSEPPTGVEEHDLEIVNGLSYKF